MNGSGAEHVVINEIAWMGTPVEGVDSRQEWRYEWLELYNASASDMSLSGWSIELYRSELDFEIPLQGTITAHGYFLVGASQRIDEIDVDYGTLAGKFANAGQRIVLRDSKDTVVEEVDAREGWFAGDNESKLSMERRFPEQDAGDRANWGSSILTGGTPKAENSIFGKEAIVELEPQAFSAIAKESPSELPFADVFTNAVFILALLLALASALLVLLVRGYLLAPRRRSRSAGIRAGQAEGSSGAHLD